jgi:hypothetical protein
MRMPNWQLGRGPSSADCQKSMRSFRAGHARGVLQPADQYAEPFGFVQ